MNEIRAALGELYDQAGRPSSRSLALRAGISHTTIADTLAGRRLPTLATLLHLVRALDGEPETFVALYNDHDAPVPARPGHRELLQAILDELRQIRDLLTTK